MPAVEAPVNLRVIGHFIGGQPLEPTSGRSGVVWDPATGDPQASVQFASAAEVDHAVAVAKAAFPAWRATPLSRRAEILFRLRELVNANRREIGRQAVALTCTRFASLLASWQALRPSTFLPWFPCGCLLMPSLAATHLS